MSAGAEPLDDVEFPLGEYRVLQLLGRGGIGEVFVAQRRGGAALCALKRLRPDVQSVGAAHARIRREAHLATYLDHPNICRVLDAGVEDGTFFLATEFVNGVDLERIVQELARRRLALASDMVQSIMLQVLAGLDHAHRATSASGRHLGVVHRDLSPRNIMVTFDGRVKIIDFGVARAEVDDYRTKPGVLVGTLKFLSPEQAMGTPVDARSDVYSIGAVMYEMLTGRSVLSSGKDLIEALQEIVSGEPRPVRDFNPSVCEDVVRVLNRALAKERNDRFASAANMRRALAAAGGEPASEAALGQLVKGLFQDLADRMDSVAARAQASLTPPPRMGTNVDPFSATAVGPSPSEAYSPTRAGRPDEFDLDEPPVERTRAELATALAQVEAGASKALLPTRLLSGETLDAPALPMNAPTVTMPVAASSPPTVAGRRGGLIVGLMAVAVGFVLLAVFLQNRSPPPAPTQIVQAPSPGVRPSVAPRPEAPTVAPRARAPEPSQPRARPARTAAPARAPRPVRTPRASAPTPAPRRDPLQSKLSRLARAVDDGGALDLAALTAVLDEVERRAARLDRAGPMRQVRRARDCLASCPTQEKMIARVRAALGAVREAEAQ